MRILVSCQQSCRRHPIPAYEFWRPYFVRGLTEAGHEVLEVPGVDWAEGLVHPSGAALDLWRERTWQTVRSFVRAERRDRPVDLFLSYLYPAQIEVGAIRDLQSMGIPCVNFFCDNVREFRTVPAEFRAFALHWVPEFEALHMYRGAGLAHVHAPMPCWIPLELRGAPSAETEPATFLGSADVLRRDLLVRALWCGADFVVRGPGWGSSSSSLEGSQPPRSIVKLVTNQWNAVRRHGLGILWRKLRAGLWPMQALPIPSANIRATVTGTEYLRVTREAAVTIGINRVPTAKATDRRPLKYSRLRDVEAPMVGACYLTEWTEGLGELYELGHDIETYRTPEELGVKLTDLQKNPERRLLMRRRGQMRAIHEHSVSRSVSRIIQRLGLSTHG